MIRQTNTRNLTSTFAAKTSLVRRFAQCAALLALCAGMLSGGAAPVAVHASQYMITYELGHSYIYYNENNIPDPSGTLREATTATDQDGHVWDIYNNQVAFNIDHSITDTSNQVVGFVYYPAPDPGQ